MTPLIIFIVVALIVGVLLYYGPQILPIDAQVWLIIKVVSIIALLLYGLFLLTGKKLF